MKGNKGEIEVQLFGDYRSPDEVYIEGTFHNMEHRLFKETIA